MLTSRYGRVPFAELTLLDEASKGHSYLLPARTRCPESDTAEPKDRALGSLISVADQFEP